MIKIKMDAKDFQKHLNGFKDKIKTRAIARDVREVAIGDILRTFKTSGSNLGKRWAELSNFTTSRRRGGSSVPLRDTGGLMQSVQGRIISSGVEMYSYYFAKGINVAAVQHYGIKPYRITEKQRAWFRYQGVYFKKGKKLSMPARPFMYISKKGAQDIAGVVFKVTGEKK